MSLTNEQKKNFKSIGHHLKPVVMVGENGLSDNLNAEVERALRDHELIKVQVRVADRDSRREVIHSLCSATDAQLVQIIGKVALIYRKAETPNRQLSNLHRE